MVSTIGRALFAALLCIASVPFCRAAERPERLPTVSSTGGMVVSVSETASRAGATILEQGGNAVDAAVATAFALAVTYPPAGNIGGGGFMMILPEPHAEPVCVDYRETAPATATPTMFALTESRLGAKAVGVPGTVRGLALAHRQYGRMDWDLVVAPAMRLAYDGFPVDEALAKSLNETLRDEQTQPFTEMRRVFAPPDAVAWRAADRLVQPELGMTLTRISRDGSDGFYQGPVADSLVEEMRTGGGLITADDLARYRAQVRRPVHGTYRGFDVYGPPPPSSGGIVLVEMLNVLEHFDLRAMGRTSSEACHLVIEAMRRAYLDRARHLGDPDFVRIPAHLTSKSYAAQLVEEIDRRRASSSETLAPDIPLTEEPASTTHFSVVDTDGMAVSNTYTLEQSYGSRVVVRQHGFLLNNQMGDFNPLQGHTDRQGRIGTTANLVAPGKRMLSSQTPVLVLHNGQPYLIVGSPGGRTIINTVLCILLNVLDHQLDLGRAVAAPRWHHQWLPDVARFEAVDDPANGELITHLTDMGHRIDPESASQGDAHCILIDAATGLVWGVADDRVSGSAVPVPASTRAVP